MKRAYKFRAYPTGQQEGRALQLLAHHCDLYNAALQERREAWRMCKVSIRYDDQSPSSGRSALTTPTATGGIRSPRSSRRCGG